MIIYIDGSVEYLTVTVTADVELVDQPIEISIDRGETWLPAVWQGDPGTTRKARTVAPVAFDAPPASNMRPSSHTVWVRVTDNPEVPIVSAGSFQISAWV